MADRFYGLNRNDSAVSVDTSTTSKEIELRVATGATITKLDIQLALEKLEVAVAEDTDRDEI